MPPAEAATPPEYLRLLEALFGKTEVDKPPIVTFTKPVATGQEYTVEASPIALAGRATDDKMVFEVQWTNVTTEASGTASLSDGTTS